MYKLLLVICMLPIVLQLHSLQADEELAVRMFFQVKQALNRAVHAGAQQVDPEALSEGRYRLDPERAELVMLAYLRENLNLDESLRPMSGSLLRSPVEIVEFEIVEPPANGAPAYRSTSRGDIVRFDRPGVLLTVRVEYPQAYRLLNPIAWEITSAGQLSES